MSRSIRSARLLTASFGCVFSILAMGVLFFVSASPARAEEPTTLRLVLNGSYASTDGRMEKTDSQLTFAVTEDGTAVAGDMDGFSIRNFQKIKDGPWQMKWQTTVRGQVVEVYGYTVSNNDGSAVLYTYFRYPVKNDGVLYLEVYGEYRP